MIDLRLGDCLDVMGVIPDGSIDLIACDLPYGTTPLRWDQVIPFEPLWAHYKRLLKPRGAVILTASQPFTTDIINSNRRWFRYTLVWNKKQSGSFQTAKYVPLKIHEDIVVLGSGSIRYNPQMRKGKYRKRGGAAFRNRATGPRLTDGFENYGDEYYPTSILEFPNERAGKLHPMQKPVALFEYILETYSNEGDTVLDNAMGSGTTLEACLNTNRHGIGIESDPVHFATAEHRLAAASNQTPLFAG